MKNKIYYVFMVGFAGLLVGSTALRDGFYLKSNDSNVEINSYDVVAPAPPTIESLSVNQITNKNAVVNWEINVANYTTVELSPKIIDNDSGREINLYKSNENLGGGSYEGSYKIRNLDGNTKYNWKFIVEWTWEGNGTTNDGKPIEQDFEFTTVRDPYEAPTIEEFSVDESSIDITSATINWDINDPNDLISELKLVNRVGKEIDITDFIDDGSYTITNLEADKNYMFHLEAIWSDDKYVDNNGILISDTISFTTLDLSWQKPIVNSFSITENRKTDTSMPITWNVDDLNGTVTNIKVVDESGNLVEDLNTTLNGTQTIDKLDPNTEYNWKLSVEWKNKEHDTSGVVESDLITFTTLSKYETTHLIEYDVVNITETSATIKWEYDSHSLNRIWLYNNGVLVLDLGNSYKDEITIDTLSPDTEYNCYIEAEYNASGDNYFINSDTITFSTKSFERIKIDEFNITTLNESSAQVDWEITDPNSMASDIKIIDEKDNVVADLGTAHKGSTRIDRLDPSTEYNWKLAIYWNDSAYGKSGTKVSLPRKFETMTDYEAPIIETFNVESNNRTSAQIDWAITDESSIVNNVKMVDESNNTIIDLGTSTEGSTTIDRLDPSTEYNWKLVVSYNYEMYEMSNTIESELISFETSRDAYDAPTIEEFIITPTNRTSAQIDWAISDPNNIVSHIKIVNDNNELVKDLGTSLKGSTTIDRLDPSTKYNWKLVIDYNDEFYINNNGTLETELISFETSRDAYDAPTIEAFSVESNNIGTATIDWAISDPNNLITNVIVIDDNDSKIIELGTAKSGTIDIGHQSLIPLSEHHWKLIVEWDDPLYDGEINVESSFIDFVAATEQTADSNFIIILISLIVLIIIIIGGGVLIAMPKKG